MLFGALQALFTFSVISRFQRGSASKALPVLFFAASLCFFFSGPFVMDPMGTPQAAMSIHGTPVASATGYRVFRSNFAAGPFVQLADTNNTTTFTDASMNGPSTYHYRISALLGNREGACGNTVSGCGRRAMPKRL